MGIVFIMAVFPGNRNISYSAVQKEIPGHTDSQGSMSYRIKSIIGSGCYLFTTRHPAIMS